VVQVRIARVRGNQQSNDEIPTPDARCHGTIARLRDRDSSRKWFRSSFVVNSINPVAEIHYPAAALTPSRQVSIYRSLYSPRVRARSNWRFYHFIISHRYSNFIIVSYRTHGKHLAPQRCSPKHTSFSLSPQMLAAIPPPPYNISQSMTYTHSPNRASAVLDPVSPAENKVCPGCHLTVMDENGGIVIAFG
jgi:hypothetical protein